MKKLFFKSLTTLIVVLCVQLTFAQATIKLVAPKNGTTIANNMPTLSWQKVAATSYEVWIDGIKMGEVPSSQNGYVPFPLSFGQHYWKVVALTATGKIESPIQQFSVNDKPLSDVPNNSILIRTGWKVKSSIEVGMNGAKLSKSGVNTKSWASTSVPATVLTALVRNGIYPNPYVSKNNMLIPDINDEFNKEYDLLKYSHIPNVNPWQKPYWYRNEFDVPANLNGKKLWLTFGEINYKAEVWLNGVKVTDTTDMVGMERVFKFDVTKLLKKGSKNVLAVAIYPPNHPGKPANEPLTPLADPGTNMADGVIGRDYTKWDVMGWDWQPSIRDRDMGITEDVFITPTDNVEFDNLYVSSNLNLPDTTNADLTISVDLVNHSSVEQKGVVTVKVINGKDVISFEQPYTIPANSTKEFFWDKKNVKQLRIKNAKLWWPFGYGQQNLYAVNLTTQTSNNDKASVATNLGIRKVETYIGAKERVYKINGKEIYAKGGNWVIDMMLNWTSSRYENEILLTKNSNLNMLRVWGPTGIAPKSLFDAADKHGVLMWQDFLNDFWGTFKNTPGYQPEISLYEKATVGIVKRYRNHPSLVMWCGGNEGPNPREDLIVNTILKKYDGRDSRHYLKQSDGDGLHGGGPYHTMEPKEYFQHPKLSGFSSEIGPSGIPVYENIVKFLPEVKSGWYPGRFPLDGYWAYHDANDWPGEDSRKFSSYDNMVQNYYGKADSSSAKGLESYVNKCQIVNYDVYRASIESINRQLWSNASGILLWKSNSSWPSITWQVYDWYLQSHAGFYGTKKASEHVHVQLNRDDMSVSFLNLLSQKMEDVKVAATLYSTSGKPEWVDSEIITVGANSVLTTNLVIPENEVMQFLKLVVTDKSGAVVAENFYWISKNNDYKALNSLGTPSVDVTAKKLDDRKFEVTVANKGNNVAFMVGLKLVEKESLQEILPSLWSDNYFCLLPGEAKTVNIEVAGNDRFEAPLILYKAFNSPENEQIKIQ